MKAPEYPLSVILLTHNQADILRMQIIALERQQNIKASDFEIIVTDDSSRPDEIRKIRSILANTTLTCHLLRQQSDRFRAAKARNSAIRVAKGNLLLFLDGDMIPEVDALSKHVLMQEGKKGHVIAGHRLRRRIEPQGDGGVWDFDQILHLCRTSDLIDPVIARWQQAEDQKRIEFLQSAHPWRVVFSCHMSVRAAPEIAFDENFIGWGPEDWELAYRLTHRHGYTVDFAPHITAYEVDHLGQGVGNVFRVRTQMAIIDYVRNTFYFFDRCPGLGVEEVFWGLRKLELRGNEWVVTPTNKDCDINQRITEARSWLAANKHYTTSVSFQ